MSTGSPSTLAFVCCPLSRVEAMPNASVMLRIGYGNTLSRRNGEVSSMWSGVLYLRLIEGGGVGDVRC